MIATPSAVGSRRSHGNGSTVTVFSPIIAGSTAWGVMVAEAAGDRALGRSDLDLLAAVSGFVELMADRSHLAKRVIDQRAQAQALARMSTDLSSRLRVPGHREQPDRPRDRALPRATKPWRWYAKVAKHRLPRVLFRTTRQRLLPASDAASFLHGTRLDPPSELRPFLDGAGG